MLHLMDWNEGCVIKPSGLELGWCYKLQDLMYCNRSGAIT